LREFLLEKLLTILSGLIFWREKTAFAGSSKLFKNPQFGRYLSPREGQDTLLFWGFFVVVRHAKGKTYTGLEEDG